MKKKSIYNVGMVIIILLLVFAGLAAVGTTKGWFCKDADFYASQKTGIVVVERNGLAYEIQESSAIRPGDIIHTNTPSELEISDGKEKTPFIWLNGKTNFSITQKDEKLEFEVSKGEVFADIKDGKNAAAFVSKDMKVVAEQAVLSVSAQSGSSMVCVYTGKVSVTVDDTKQTVMSGQVMSVVKSAKEKKNITVSELQMTALNDFQMTRLLDTDMNNEFCFAKADLREVKQNREKERIEAQQAKLLARSEEEEKKDTVSADGSKNEKKPDKAAEKRSIQRAADETEETDVENIPDNENATGTLPKDSENSNTTESENVSKDTENDDDTSKKKTKKKKDNKSKEDSTTDNDSEEAQVETETETETKTEAEEQTQTEEIVPEDITQYCTIEIRCDTILNNMANLAPGKDVYVPADGTLLAASKVEFAEGETAFDILKRACELMDMPLEYSYTPVYESYYVEGINQLYEFDCGSQSGWVYKVNGWFPNYGCSAYPVQKEDAIVFCYTCTGLGADVGGGNFQ